MEIHFTLIALGALLLVGLVAHEVGRRTRLPRVTLMILFGVGIGPAGFDLLPAEFKDWYDYLASVALTMVAFLLGGKLSLANLRHNGRAIMIVSAVAVITSTLIVGGALLIAGAPLILALLLAGISSSTDPAATQDVVRQTGANGPFTSTLLGVVAVDDAWGLLVFSFVLMAAKIIAGDGSADVLLLGLQEVGIALAIGIGIGVPAAFLARRLRGGEPIQAEALGIVLICAGLAIWLDSSFLLAS